MWLVAGLAMLVVEHKKLLSKWNAVSPAFWLLFWVRLYEIGLAKHAHWPWFALDVGMILMTALVLLFAESLL